MGCLVSSRRRKWRNESKNQRGIKEHLMCCCWESKQLIKFSWPGWTGWRSFWWWGGHGGWKEGNREIESKNLRGCSSAQRRPHNQCNWGNIIVIGMDKLSRANQSWWKAAKRGEDGGLVQPPPLHPRICFAFFVKVGRAILWSTVDPSLASSIKNKPHHFKPSCMGKGEREKARVGLLEMGKDVKGLSS